MIQIKRYDHISMAVPDLDPQIAIMERLFGFRFRVRFHRAHPTEARPAIPSSPVDQALNSVGQPDASSGRCASAQRVNSVIAGRSASPASVSL